MRHYTSRAGDPHRHLHLQINARVWAAGRWRGIHTVGVRDSLDAINGIGHAAVMCDPGFRAALARHGYSLDRPVVRSPSWLPTSAPSVPGPRRSGTTSSATRPSGEPTTRTRNPAPSSGRPGTGEPGPRPAPTRSSPETAPSSRSGGSRSCTASASTNRGKRVTVDARRRSVGSDRDALVETALTRLGSKRSAWNAADIRGEMEQQIAAAGVVTDPAVRRELAEDLTARAIEACTPLLARDRCPRTRPIPRPHHRSSRSRTASPPRSPLAPSSRSPPGTSTQSPAFDDAQKARPRRDDRQVRTPGGRGSRRGRQDEHPRGLLAASSNTKGTAWSW